MTAINYENGIYRVTPMGEHTAFECYVQKRHSGDGYVLISLTSSLHVEVSQEQLDRMKPVFIRKDELRGVS